MGSGRGGLHRGTWGSREGEALRARVGAAFEKLGSSIAGGAAAELAEALVRIASGESPEDAVPEPGEVAFDLALDALSTFMPGGPAATRSLALAAKADKSARQKARVLSRDGIRAPRQIWLPADEYAMVMSALNNMYHVRLKGKKREYVSIGEHTYEVVIHDFDEYQITGKWRLE